MQRRNSTRTVLGIGSCDPRRDTNSSRDAAMTARQALALVESHGVLLESARGRAPNLAEMIAGERIQGSWWSHPKAAQILRCSRAIRDSSDVLVCRLVDGKVTYVHRRLWPALVKLSARIEPGRLAAIREVHTRSGAHQVSAVAFPEWVPKGIVAEAARLSVSEAASLLPKVVTETAT